MFEYLKNQKNVLGGMHFLKVVSATFLLVRFF